MMKKFIVIENEHIARRQLINSIQSLRPDWRCIGYSETVTETVDLLNSCEDCDLIFMDIELDDGNCFDILQLMDIDTPVIFTTAYSEYALRAFKLNSVDYLVKPIIIEELKQALDKYDRHHDEPVDDTVFPKITPQRIADRLLVSTSQGYSYINTSDVLMFASEDKCVFAIRNNGTRQLLAIPTLNNLEEVLDPHKFFRASRDTIISIESVDNVERFIKGRLAVHVQFATGQRELIIVPAARRHDFLTWLGNA